MVPFCKILLVLASQFPMFLALKSYFKWQNHRTNQDLSPGSLQRMQSEPSTAYGSNVSPCFRRITSLTSPPFLLSLATLSLSPWSRSAAYPSSKPYPPVAGGIVLLPSRRTCCCTSHARSRPGRSSRHPRGVACGAGNGVWPATPRSTMARRRHSQPWLPVASTCPAMATRS